MPLGNWPTWRYLSVVAQKTKFPHIYFFMCIFIRIFFVGGKLLDGIYDQLSAGSLWVSCRMGPHVTECCLGNTSTCLI